MAEYDTQNPSNWERHKYSLVYDAWHGRYFRGDGKDRPDPNFKVNEYTSRDGMTKEFTRGAPLTPEAHQQLSAEKLAYDSVFDTGYAENAPTRKTKQGFMERLIFGRDS